MSNMDISHTQDGYRVGFVLVDGFSLMSYASAMEPLRACNLLAGRALYNVRHIPASGTRAISSSGARIVAEAYPGEQTDFDLLLVVAGGDLSQAHFPDLNHWLRLLDERGVLMGGVSGGPLLLVRAGLMEGRRMTVHWDHAQELASLSARIMVERSLYVRDRDRLTCGGGTAPLDMMHALIREHHGAAFARQISDWFLQTSVRQGEQAQQAGLSERYDTTDATVLKALDAMENHIGDPLALSQIASLTGVGVRQLNRVFRTTLATSPVQFYRRIRLQKAQDMLSRTSLSIQEIALATGFANGAHLSRAFRQGEGIPPRQYRQTRQSDHQSEQ